MVESTSNSACNNRGSYIHLLKPNPQSTKTYLNLLDYFFFLLGFTSKSITSLAKAVTAVLFDSLCRGVTDYLRQRLLKSQLVSLAARQRTLVEILQKQMHLLGVYVTKKAQLSRQPSNHPSSTAVTHQRDPFSSPASTPASANASEMHSFYQDSQRKESNRPFTVASLLRSAPTNNIKALEVPRACGPLLTQEENTLKNTDVLNKEASSFQSCALRPRNSSQCINFQMKGYNALIHTRAEDNSRHHSQHIRTGVMPPGRTSQMLLKVRKNLSHTTYLILV